jgi:hypothetical protein
MNEVKQDMAKNAEGIEVLLAQLQSKVQALKDLQSPNWADAGELGRIWMQLDEMVNPK